MKSEANIKEVSWMPDGLHRELTGVNLSYRELTGLLFNFCGALKGLASSTIAAILCAARGRTIAGEFDPVKTLVINRRGWLFVSGIVNLTSSETEITLNRTVKFAG